jgi:hypothetical protein
MVGLPEPFWFNIKVMQMTIITPKGKYNAKAFIGQHGKYGRHFVYVLGYHIVEGDYEYCKMIFNKLLTGKRQLPKRVLRMVEKLLVQNARRNLEYSARLLRDNKLKSYHEALGYIVRKHTTFQITGFYEACKA